MTYRAEFRRHATFARCGPHPQAQSTCLTESRIKQVVIRGYFYCPRKIPDTWIPARREDSEVPLCVGGPAPFPGSSLRPQSARTRPRGSIPAPKRCGQRSPHGKFPRGRTKATVGNRWSRSPIAHPRGSLAADFLPRFRPPALDAHRGAEPKGSLRAACQYPTRDSPWGSSHACGISSWMLVHRDIPHRVFSATSQDPTRRSLLSPPERPRKLRPSLFQGPGSAGNPNHLAHLARSDPGGATREARPGGKGPGRTGRSDPGGKGRKAPGRRELL
jgi:hypothetical protein